MGTASFTLERDVLNSKGEGFVGVRVCWVFRFERRVLGPSTESWYVTDRVEETSEVRRRGVRGVVVAVPVKVVPLSREEDWKTLN